MKQTIKQNPVIKITETTKLQLDKLKLIKCETYDSVIERLIENNSRRLI